MNSRMNFLLLIENSLPKYEKLNLVLINRGIVIWELDEINRYELITKYVLKKR